MPIWLGHLLLALAVCALGSAAIRVASLAAPRGLPRLLAAAPYGVAAAVAEALALGLVGWGGSPVALTLVAVVTWVVVRALAPRPRHRVRDDLIDAWRGLHRETRMIAGALAGLGAAYLVFVLRYPELGFDGIVYHLPEVVAWVQGGHPGSVIDAVTGLPVGAYPVTDEVAIAWATGIARTLVPVTVFTPLMLVLLLASGWAGLRALRTPAWVTALALAAVATLPLVVAQLTGPNTDVPALAWLACEAALCALALTRKAPGTDIVAPPAAYGPGEPVPPGAAGGRPDPPRALLLVPALVAFALAIGTKTTVAPLGAALLLAALWLLRRELRPVAIPLVGALVLGLVVGGTWYLRNLFEHGSPLWPFVSGPFGDPIPPALKAVSTSLLDRPRVTLEGHLDDYAAQLAGGVVLLAGGIAAALAGRRAAVASAVTLLSFLLWTAAPVTGVSEDPAFAAIAISAVRYLLPALAAGAVALALAAGEPRRWAPPAAGVLLGGAIVWNVIRDAEVGFPVVAPASTLIVGVVIGTLVAWLAGWLIVRIPLVAGVIVFALLLAFAAPGYVDRHGETSRDFDPDLSTFMAAQPGFANGDQPIGVAPNLIGPLAGDRLTHRLTLLHPDTPCPRVRELARKGWVVLRALPSVVVQESPRVVLPEPVTARRCLEGVPRLFDRGAVEVYSLRPAAAAPRPSNRDAGGERAPR